MSWEAGVDLVACTDPTLTQPNLIVHLARLVHTPRGSASAGMVLYQPDPCVAPRAVGFVCADEKIGAYFGPTLFAGTPFAGAPFLAARLAVEVGPSFVGATVSLAGLELRTRLEALGPLTLVQRTPTNLTPFYQQGVEAAATRARLWVNGEEVSLVLPSFGLSGGPAAVFSPTGLYAR